MPTPPPPRSSSRHAGAPRRPAPSAPVSSGDHRISLGRRGEALAAELLEAAGLEIVARNWRLCSGELRGELDLVALDRRRGTVIICEVKARRGDGYGGPLAAITPRKQAKIRVLASAFLREASLPAARVRFDVVAVWLVPGEPPRLRHVTAAF